MQILVFKEILLRFCDNQFLAIPFVMKLIFYNNCNVSLILQILLLKVIKINVKKNIQKSHLKRRKQKQLGRIQCSEREQNKTKMPYFPSILLLVWQKFSEGKYAFIELAFCQSFVNLLLGWGSFDFFSWTRTTSGACSQEQLIAIGFIDGTWRYPSPGILGHTGGKTTWDYKGKEWDASCIVSAPHLHENKRYGIAYALFIFTLLYFTCKVGKQLQLANGQFSITSQQHVGTKFFAN